MLVNIRYYWTIVFEKYVTTTEYQLILSKMKSLREAVKQNVAMRVMLLHDNAVQRKFKLRFPNTGFRR